VTQVGSLSVPVTRLHSTEAGARQMRNTFGSALSPRMKRSYSSRRTRSTNRSRRSMGRTGSDGARAEKVDENGLKEDLVQAETSLDQLGTSLASGSAGAVSFDLTPNLSETFSQCEAVKRIESLEATPPSIMQRRGSFDSIETGIRHLNWVRWRLRRLVRDSWFEAAMSVIIISNALFCGVEVEYMAHMKIQEPPLAFKIMSIVYAVTFTMELAVRLGAEGRTFFKPPTAWWNLFDAIICLVSLLEVAADFEGSAGRQLPSVRTIRMARVVRILRVARVMRHFRALRILIYSVMNTLRSLFWTVLMLSIILYIFGLLFTQATAQHLQNPDAAYIPRLEDSYGSIARSVFTLFKAISGGVSWEEVVDPLQELSPIWVLFFLMYFSFTYFAVLNVVTGVFCQTAIESASHDQDVAAQAQLAAKQHYVRQLRALFDQINVNNTGTITLGELEQCMEDDKLQAYFATIDLSVDEAFSLFKLLDHGDTHVLDIDTFVTGCLKLRGQAKSLDIAMMMYETRWGLQKVLRSLKALECDFSDFRENSSQLLSSREVNCTQNQQQVLSF